MELPYAEDINYWKTGKSSPETWIERTLKIISNSGGEIIREAFGSESGRAAYLIEFSINGDNFKIVWPVLTSKTDNDKAARVQAVTLLYHDTKAKCLKATVWGHRTAFFEYLTLPDGRQASQLSAPEIMAHVPDILQITTKGG